MKNKTFSIDISVEQLQKVLEDALKIPHKKMVADIIIRHLDRHSVTGLSQLYLALSGVSTECRFKPGDEVLIDIDDTPSWKYDKSLIVQGEDTLRGKLKATVKEIDITQSEPVIIEFYGYAINYSTKAVSDHKSLITYSVKPEKLIKNDEFDFPIE